MIPRVDLIFSYWILFWYILYITKTITCCSPKFALFLGIIENIVLLFYISFNGASLSTIIKFIVIIVVMKIIPYYAIRNDKIVIKDIIVTLLLFIIYMIWLKFNDFGVLDAYNSINNSLIKNNGDTPGIMLIDTVLNFFNVSCK